MVMKAKIRLEDDIVRWYHVRMGIYSTVLVFSVMIFPMVVLTFLSSSYLKSPYEMNFIAAAVPLLAPNLLKFSDSLIESASSLICLKSVVRQILELARNSEDTSILDSLTKMPKSKNKDVDEDELQETNLTKFILVNTLGPKTLPKEEQRGNKVAPTKNSKKDKNQAPIAPKKKVNLQESTKPLLLLQNVTFMSKIGIRILDGISLKLYEAERIALVCEKSSGKDFLILLIMTLLQRSEIPALGQSSYEILGKPVTLGSSSELRKNITFLSAKPTLLTGTVRQNVDPFARFEDEEIMRVLHFLKIIKVLQEYSGMFKCEDIELFLLFKQGKIVLNELYLDEIKKRDRAAVSKQRSAERERLGQTPVSKKTILPSVKDMLQRKRSSYQPPGPAQGSEQRKTLKNGTNLNPIKVPESPEKTPKNKIEQLARQGTKGKMDFTPEASKAKSTAEASRLSDMKSVELPLVSGTQNLLESKAGAERREARSDSEEIEEVSGEEEESPRHPDELNRLDTKKHLDSMLPTDKLELFRRNKLLLYEIRRILDGYVAVDKPAEELKAFFESQFSTDYPLPNPIAERAKRLNDELEDFDGDYSNHEIHFEDERDLLKKFLSMEVGQNGKHLNEDTRKIIMMARAYLEKPPILFIDEEATYVAGVNRAFYLKQIFTNLREAGILALSKDLRQLHLYSNVAVVRQGKIVEQGPPLDLIDDKKSLMYSIVLQDDIRTLRQLEHKLEKNIRKFEHMQNAQRRRKLNTDKESLDRLTSQMVESGSVTPQVKDNSQVRTPSNNYPSMQAQASKTGRRHFTMLKLLANDHEAGEEEQEDELDQQPRSNSQMHIEIPTVGRDPTPNYLAPHALPLNTSKSTPGFLKST